MSIIVAVTKSGRTGMAADTLTSFEGSVAINQRNSRTPKFRRIGDAFLGASGWGVYDAIITDFIGDEPPPSLTGERNIFRFFMDLWKALHEDYAFVNDQSQAKDSPFGDLDASFLIASHAGIHKVSHDMDVTPFERYYAIGSGTDYALGALHTIYDEIDDPAVIAQRAVEAACAFDLHCGGEIEVVEAPPPSLPAAAQSLSP